MHGMGREASAPGLPPVTATRGLLAQLGWQVSLVNSPFSSHVKERLAPAADLPLPAWPSTLMIEVLCKSAESLCWALQRRAGAGHRLQESHL